MRYLLVFVMLLGCGDQANPQTPEEWLQWMGQEQQTWAWPHTAVVHADMLEGRDALRIEVIRNAFDEINRAVGASVWQLAVTNDISKAGCDTILISWHEEILNSEGDAALGKFRPEKCNYTLKLKDNGDTRKGLDYASEKTVVHEILHSMGFDHDTFDPSSVMYSGPACLSRPENPDEPLFGCDLPLPKSLTPRHIAKIRQMMGLK